MLRAALLLTAGLFLWGSSPLVHAEQLALAEWEPEEGDMFIVDTKENIGYIRHPDGDYATVYLATGQRRWVTYIGRSYNATTPEGWWTVKSTTIQPDRRTFGPSGLFLRLYWGGKDYTSYGIHSNANIADMLKEPLRYFSMGCILVDDHVLGLLQESYQLNGDQLHVLTKYGVEKEKYLVL